LLYHILLVHGLWYAPLYGWLLLVSAWSPRAPLVWAVLPPFVIGGVEKLAFNTTYAFAWVQERLLGPQSHSGMAGNAGKDWAAELIPVHFFTEPGLWIGLAIAAVLLAGAIRLRRYRGPI
jgi:ABC-2 type transport system permease protein